MSVTVPNYQNFVPAKGHTRLPSAHEVKEAKRRGLPAPEPEVVEEDHVRADGPKRKHGYENYVPGPEHKLMPTWAQIQAEEARQAKRAARPTPTASQEDFPKEDHQCTQCDKRFDTYRKLLGHKTAHRGK